MAALLADWLDFRLTGWLAYWLLAELFGFWLSERMFRWQIDWFLATGFLARWHPDWPAHHLDDKWTSWLAGWPGIQLANKIIC